MRIGSIIQVECVLVSLMAWLDKPCSLFILNNSNYSIEYCCNNY